jgi:hypothetical protein
VKKETTPDLPEQGPYPKVFLMLLIAFAISIYILWPFPDEPLLKLIRHQWFQHSFWVIFTISVAQVWLVAGISSWLDEKYKWEQKFYHRIFGQLIIGWIVPVAVSALISWFWFQYLEADIHGIRYAYNSYMFKTIMDIAMILNLIYLGYSISWLLRKRLKEEPIQEVKSPYTNHLFLQIPDGKEEIKVQVNEIAYLCHQGKGTMLRAHDNRAFIFWESLDKIEKQLDPALFLRASRTYIINHKAIKSWERQRDRRLLLEIQPKTVKPVEISREKAGEVIAWIKKERSKLNDT